MNGFQVLALIVLAPACAWTLYVGLREHSRKVFFVSLTLGSALFFVLRPDAATRVANLLGIGRGADLVFYLTTLAVLRCYYLILSIERKIRIQITELTRTIALLQVSSSAPTGSREQASPELENLPSHR